MVQRSSSRSRSPPAHRQGTPQPSSRLTYLQNHRFLAPETTRLGSILMYAMSLATEYITGNRLDVMDRLARKLGDVVTNLGGVARKIAQQVAARPDIIPEARIRAALRDLFANNPARPLKQIEKQARDKLKDHGGLTIKSVLKVGTIGEVSHAEIAQANGTNAQYALKTANPEQHDLFVADFKITSGGLMGKLNKAFQVAENFSASAGDVRRMTQQVVNICNEEEFQDDTMREFDFRWEADLMGQGQQWLQSAGEFFSYPPGFVRTPEVKEVSSDGSVMMMEMIQGMNLVARFPKGASCDMKEKEKKNDIAKVLVELFVHGLVIGPVLHADLHPGNVMESDGVVLVDWGITVVVPTALRGTVCQLLQCLMPSKANLTSNQDLQQLFEKLQCMPKGQYSQEIDYKHFGHPFNVIAQVKGIEPPSVLKEVEVQRPRWMTLWEKATGALVNSLHHLDVDANVLEEYFDNVLKQVSK